MSDEPIFSVKPLADENKPKRKTVRKKPARSVAQTAKQKKVDDQLIKIYAEENGSRPDFSRIDKKKRHPVLKFFFTVLFLGAIVAAAAWAGFFTEIFGKKTFSENQISLQISGPTDIVAGATTTYKITYTNEQIIPINAATLDIQYPEGFVFISSDLPAKNAGRTEWDIGGMRANQSGEINITGITYGSINQQQSWRVFLTYQPENFTSQFQKASILTINSPKSPFDLKLTGPEKAVIGDTANYTLTLKKTGDTNASKLELTPVLPSNFFISSSSPKLNKDNKWIILPNSPLNTSSVWQFKISGRFSSSSENTAPLVAKLFINTEKNNFEIAEANISTELTQSNLSFSEAINGSITDFNIQPGGMLNITVNLKNLTTYSIKNAAIRLRLDAPSAKKISILDWSKIVDEHDGDLNGSQIDTNTRRGEIKWTKLHIPALAEIKPGQEINVDVQLPIKSINAFDYDQINTWQIISLAEVDYTDQSKTGRTMSGNPIKITLSSDLKFEGRDEASADNKKHQITWVLTNNFHSLKNIILSADAYGNFTWDHNPSTTPAGVLSFNEANKRITWLIPEMPDSTDVLAAPFALNFTSINPTQDLLISKVHVQAEDAVTGEKLDFMGDETPLISATTSPQTSPSI